MKIPALFPAARLRAFFLLDFDGTLARIQRDPNKVRLAAGRRALLRRLGRRFPVAVISGRSLTDIRRRIGLRGIIYAGNHGLEIAFPEGIWIHPRAAELRLVVQDALREIRRRTRGIPGLFIENKGLSGTVHLRRVPASWKLDSATAVRNAVRSRRRFLRISRGKEALEIRPAVPWDKGRAVLFILRRCAPEKAFPVYIGDDRTDEDAFAALRRKGRTILVGAGRSRTRARLRLRGIPEVWSFLADSAQD